MILMTGGIVIFLSLQDHCDMLFNALVTPFNCENKRLAQHWTTHNQSIHWPVACI